MQYLLSSSMDKTVRLWHMSSTYCLKAFSHSDYGKNYAFRRLPLHVRIALHWNFSYQFLDSVTCIQFNPVDDRYFISGSLDEKVRIWSIPKREIVDWVDLHEMITAACYTPDGQVWIHSCIIGQQGLLTYCLFILTHLCIFCRVHSLARTRAVAMYMTRLVFLFLPLI
jgi:WD40 repeat protein